MGTTRTNTDAYGNAMMDCFMGEGRNLHAVERNDGYLDVARTDQYFTEFGQWSVLEKQMPELVRGRVLDVGCGAGRHALHLQNLDHAVTAIDASPLAVEVAKRRGVQQAVVASVDDLVMPNAPDLGTFDSIIMMGHNIGLLHDLETGRKILSRFAAITSPAARIIGTTRDVRYTTKECHLAYQEANLRNGRLRGQINFRIRYGMFASDWFDYLFADEDDLRRITDGTGWQLEKTIYGDGGFGGTSCLAVLSKG